MQTDSHMPRRLKGEMDSLILREKMARDMDELLARRQLDGAGEFFGDEEIIRIKDGYGVFNEAPLCLPFGTLFDRQHQMSSALGLHSSLCYGTRAQHSANRERVTQVFFQEEEHTGVRFNTGMGVSLERCAELAFKRKDWPPKRSTKEQSCQVVLEFAEKCAEGTASCGIDKMHRAEVVQLQPDMTRALERKVILCGRLRNASKQGDLLGKKSVTVSASVDGESVSMECFSFDASLKNALWVDTTAHAMLPEATYAEIMKGLDKASREQVLSMDGFLVVKMSMLTEVDVIGRAPRINWCGSGVSMQPSTRDLNTDLVLRFRNCELTCMPMHTKVHFENALTQVKANVMPLEHERAMHFENVPAFYLHSQFASDEMLQMALHCFFTSAHFQRFSLHTLALNERHKEFNENARFKGQPSIYDFVYADQSVGSVVPKIRAAMNEERGRVVLSMEALGSAAVGVGSAEDTEATEATEAVGSVGGEETQTAMPITPQLIFQRAREEDEPGDLDLGGSLFDMEGAHGCYKTSASFEKALEEIDWDEIKL